MHKIADKEFTLDDFSTEHLYGVSPEYLEDIIKRLNYCREAYLEDPIKDWWWQMIQLLPSSYNQKRTVMLNYEVLANIYKSRKNHKLNEWCGHDIGANNDGTPGPIGFCDWIKTLPYSELITDEPEFLNKKFNLPEPKDLSIPCWRPITEFDINKYGWVLVRQADAFDKFLPTVARMCADGEWYDQNNNQLPYDVVEFFDMQQLDDKED